MQPVEGDTVIVNGVELKVVACDREHDLYELKALMHAETHHAVVLTAAQIEAATRGQP